MSKFVKIIGAALLSTSLSVTAFAQAGSNMNAPEPGSTGKSVVKPGTTSTGTATDASMKKQMYKGKMHKSKTTMKKDDAK